jgi:hypothetical protein
LGGTPSPDTQPPSQKPKMRQQLSRPRVRRLPGVLFYGIPCLNLAVRKKCCICDVSATMYNFAMARNSTSEPDLFSAGKFTAASTGPSAAVHGWPSRRTALPKDLPKAIRYLEDQELDWLLRAQSTKRNGVSDPCPWPRHVRQTGLPLRQSQFLSRLNHPIGQLISDKCDLLRRP